MNGGDAGDLVRKKLAPLPYKLACYIIYQVLTALEFAHSQNYIHRDIKPENILINRDTHSMKAKLSDFGLAKNFQDAGNSMLTQEKEFMGTLLFMPPEQLRNYRYVKPPADIYSTGATLYYLLTGKYIFDYPSPLDILLAEQKEEKINLNQYDDPFLMILETSPVPVEKHTNNIPDRLIRVVNKSILKNEKNRYLSAKEFKEDILKAINDL
jgi:serine/threonine-protein kinase